MWDAGLRRGEVVSLPWAAVDLAQLRIRVRGKGSVDRVVPITADLARRLAADHLPGAPYAAWSHWDSGLGISGRSLHRRVVEFGDRAGVPCHPHQFRHAYACDCLAAGLSIYDVMLLLGHRSITTTAVYLHVSPDDLASRVRAALGRRGGQLQLLA